MKKELQAILLTLAFSIGAASRLLILGWLYLIGVGSVLFFGLIHFAIHSYALNYLSIPSRKSVILILLSHGFFLSLFLFQTDFDDSRSYLIISYVFNFTSKTVETQSNLLLGVGLLCYLAVGFVIIRGARNSRIAGNRFNYIVSSFSISMFLPFLFISLFHSNKELNKVKALEQTGEFDTIERALKNPDLVIKLTINPYRTTLSQFPQQILVCNNMTEIDLTGQHITEIPDEIELLDKLEVLNLIDCDINVINPSICNCKSLRELRIGGDLIETLPECLRTMKTLKHLSIQSNSVNELMEELYKFKTLETAHFYLKDGVLDKEKWRTIEKETGIHHMY